MTKTRSASAPRRMSKRRPAAARRSKKARMAASVREAIAAIAVQRRLKKSNAKLEETDPQSELLAEYRALSAHALTGLRLAPGPHRIDSAPSAHEDRAGTSRRAFAFD
jgi:hypothetical protein